MLTFWKHFLRYTIGQSINSIPGRDNSFRLSDLFFLCFLLSTAIVIAGPSIFCGLDIYMDNPIHLAEIQDISRIDFNGWSDLGNCGLPLGFLHSPLWFNLLATFNRCGFPTDIIYILALFVSFVLPSFAIYSVSRRRLDPAPSAVIAYLLLVQHPALVGISSVFGGMWTFYIATSGFILLLNQVSITKRNEFISLKMAFLIGLISLSHAFFWVLLVILAVVHGARCMVNDDLRQNLRWDVPAFILGFLSASAYWFPVILTHNWMVIPATNLSTRLIIKLLLLPMDPLEPRSTFDVAMSLQTIPVILLIGLGVIGTWILIRKTSVKKSDSLVIAVSLGWLILGLLIFVLPGTSITWLGSQSWRLLYLTRIGFAMAGILAFEKFQRWGHIRIPKNIMIIVFLFLIGLGVVWGKPLAEVNAP